MDDVKGVPGKPELSEAAKRWLEENEEALEAYNKWYAEHGSSMNFYSLVMDDDDLGPDDEPPPPPNLSEEGKRRAAEVRDDLLAYNAWIEEHGMLYEDLRRE